MVLILVVLALLQTASASPVDKDTTCTLIEGVGNHLWKIGVTTRDKAVPTPQGVMLDYKQNVLSLIFITGDECRTSKGLKVGDSQTQVQKSYGKGKKTVVYLKKGKADSLGPFGDFVLVYPGVAFVMSESRVAAIFVQAGMLEEEKK